MIDQILTYLPVLFKISVICGIVLSVILVLLYSFQNKMMYIPSGAGLLQSPAQNPQGLRHPSEQNLEAEDVLIETKDHEKLRGWFIKAKSSYQEQPTLVFFHENAGNIGYRLTYFCYYVNMCNINLLCVAYRGYSDSTGTPSEGGIKLDAIAILDYIFTRKDIDKDKIFLHGRSLGGASLLFALSKSQDNVRGIILENTFTSMEDMVKKIFSKISIFTNLVLRNYWKSIEIISIVKQPILFISAQKDEIVPHEQMETLMLKAISAKKIFIHRVQEAHHNDTWAIDPRTYFSKITEFIQGTIDSRTNNIDNSVEEKE